MCWNQLVSIWMQIFFTLYEPELAQLNIDNLTVEDFRIFLSSLTLEQAVRVATTLKSQFHLIFKTNTDIEHMWNLLPDDYCIAMSNVLPVPTSCDLLIEKLSMNKKKIFLDSKLPELEQLRQLINEGEASGDPVKWDASAFLKQMQKKTHAK